MVTPNESESHLGDFWVATACQPQPVDNVARHEVDLRNAGYDSYVDVSIVVGICQPTQACSLRLEHGSRNGAFIPGIQVGTLPSGAELSETVAVKKNPSGTTRWEKIRTTVEFWSWLEKDPQNDVPDRPYTVTASLDVEVQH